MVASPSPFSMKTHRERGLSKKGFTRARPKVKAKKQLRQMPCLLGRYLHALSNTYSMLWRGTRNLDLCICQESCTLYKLVLPSTLDLIFVSDSFSCSRLPLAPNTVLKGFSILVANQQSWNVVCSTAYLSPLLVHLFPWLGPSFVKLVCLVFSTYVFLYSLLLDSSSHLSFLFLFTSCLFYDPEKHTWSK